MAPSRLLNGTVAGVESATALLARRSRQVAEEWKVLEPKRTGDLLRLSQCFPIWLRRHGLWVALRALDSQGGGLAERYRIRVIERLNLHHPLDLAAYRESEYTPLPAKLLADSAEALRRADIFCAVAKAWLDETGSAGAAP